MYTKFLKLLKFNTKKWLIKKQNFIQSTLKKNKNKIVKFKKNR